MELNGKDQEIVKGQISEIANSMIRISAEQDLIKEICDNAKEKFNIKPADLKKAAKFTLETEKKQDFDESADNVDFLFDIATGNINE